ncbi:MAG TPA: uroporphyrinogen-III synthase, partial [archaeon]|nr:uroporphyrinogen-III synthase [archaeon]
KTAIKNYGVKVGITPSKFSSEGIIERLGNMNLRGKTVAIPRTREVDPYLRNKLEGMGAHVLETTVYESTSPSDESKMLKLLNDMFDGKIDAITFTSSATARNLFKTAYNHGLGNKLQKCLRGKVVVAAIGPMTERTLENLGARVDVVSKEYTVEAMMNELIKYLRKK